MKPGQRIMYLKAPDGVEVNDEMDPFNPESGYVLVWGIFVQFFNRTRMVYNDQGAMFPLVELVVLIKNDKHRLEYVDPLDVEFEATGFEF